MFARFFASKNITKLVNQRNALLSLRYQTALHGSASFKTWASQLWLMLWNETIAKNARGHVYAVIMINATGNVRPMTHEPDTSSRNVRRKFDARCRRRFFFMPVASGGARFMASKLIRRRTTETMQLLVRFGHILPPPRRLCNAWRLFVCLSVCLSVC